MPVPDRPDFDEIVDEDWGQEVHDRVFAPAGFQVHGATGHSVGSSFSKHALDSVDDDPGGFLDAANNQVEIPTAREGLYLFDIEMLTVNGSAGAGNGSRTALYINGTARAWGKEDNAGGTNVPYNVHLGPVTIAAGDILSIYSQKIGSGTAPDITVQRFSGVRIGAELGA